ncbi:MAG: glycoside hydrolase family 127 protein [Armatimonadetes bacterium]|nr:glycoside hydrolase family 127 protein [Armatimonadota bacterium]MCX7967279.1 glycoside hydrolase family 127 protein [Armatimonadota bacterium]MDW8141913.1 glycoside hydrolase family 127 protein [Armatimonadota bacterium]
MAEEKMGQKVDATQWVHPSEVKLGGLLGHRFQVNERNRLLTMDENSLLSGFQNRPGVQAWIGEHVGKWLHAAVLTWQNTKNPELKAKIDRIVSKLIETQEPDGYLGTYDFPTRWTMERERGWDVWVHKYVLIGLLSYVIGTGDEERKASEDELRRKALDAACKAADLILRTFGTGEGQLDLMERSTHVGMASSSILQPMVWLFRLTGEKRYLDFCRYILWAWEHSPHGPRLLGSLLSHGDVHKTANGKAYEMMSCLVGALELYRVLRDDGKEDVSKALLIAAQRAWDDIAENHLYITGGTSLGEHFQPDHHLPNDGAVSETCATVTLLQLTLELFRLTGEAKYMDVAERTVFNHLLAAQHPNGDKWCYFTPLEGQKNYRSDINCCASSGPRAIALLPTFIYTLDPDGGIRINFYTQSELNLPKQGIRIVQETNYPYGGTVKIKFQVPQPKEFPLRLRVPNWCEVAKVAVNNEPSRQVNPGYCELRRQWRSGDTVQLEFPMELKVAIGTHTNEGKLALMCGPLVLAVDERFLPQKDLLNIVTVPTSERLPLKVTAVGTEDSLWEGERVFETEGILLAEPQNRRINLQLTDFAHSSAKGTQFIVWLPQGRK